MNEKFRNKYRIQSHRMPGWDYSATGIYFITLVTQNRVCNLGKIVQVDGQKTLMLSDFGKIVNAEWYASFERRNELQLDEFVIMPNHLHAIVVLEKPEIIDTDCTDDTHGPYNPHDTHDPDDTHVETHGRASLQSPTTQQFPSKQSGPQFVRKPKSISSFIGGFKSAINTKIDDFIDENGLEIPKYNRYNRFFQSNYHDHLIRNHFEYIRIKNYIINNPANWKNDNFCK